MNLIAPKPAVVNGHLSDTARCSDRPMGSTSPPLQRVTDGAFDRRARGLLVRADGPRTPPAVPPDHAEPQEGLARGSSPATSTSIFENSGHNHLDHEAFRILSKRKSFCSVCRGGIQGMAPCPAKWAEWAWLAKARSRHPWRPYSVGETQNAHIPLALRGSRFRWYVIDPRDPMRAPVCLRFLGFGEHRSGSAIAAANPLSVGPCALSAPARTCLLHTECPVAPRT